MINLKIEKYRKQNNLTQVNLAEHLGVSFQTVSKWERGTSYPDIELISDIADFFGITIDDLVDKRKKGVQNRKDRASYWNEEVDYLNNTRKELWNDDYIEFLVKNVWKLNEPIDIVDFGCGFGYLGMKLLPLLPKGSTYTGIDNNEKLIEQANKVFEKSRYDYQFILSDLYDYHPEKKYDVAICQAVLRHFYKPDSVIKSMVDSVKIDGKVICIEVNRVIEETGYYNDSFEYNPIKQLNLYSQIWNNELEGGGRDFSIGIKMPSILHASGLVNIQTRMNDKVSLATCAEDLQCIKNAKGWVDLDRDYDGMRNHFLRQGVSTKEADSYIEWLVNNINDINSDVFDGTVVFFRGMIITWGTKQV